MLSSKITLHVLLAICVATWPVTAFWRLNCGIVQLGRLDPILSPGTVSGHVHVISGPNNFNVTSDYNSLRASVCTSCTVQADKSAYWTPMLYYRKKNGNFVDVPNGGIIIYYLGRGQGKATAFPPGIRMVSGNVGLRAYNSTLLTYGDSKNPARPVADRTSFNCVNYDDPKPETHGFPKNMTCPQGLRAQIQFQSCWDGVNIYKPDQSHVAYLSQIDNGICPPTHPVLLPHLFYEVYYSIDQIDTSDGGKFLLSSGDETGYGFHGDFQNGWDPAVLQQAVGKCLASDVGDGTVEECAAFAPSIDQLSYSNCPRQPPLVAEQVTGLLKALPGKNPPTGGPNYVPQQLSPGKLLAPNTNTDFQIRKHPTVNVSTVALSASTKATFKGCFVDNIRGRELAGASFSNPTSMNAATCGMFCQQQGMKVFGTEYGAECYCGSKLPRRSASATDCNMVCSGNLAEYCGGGNRLSVWQISS